MSKKPDGPSFFEKLATVIVDRRNLIFFLYLCAMIFCAFSSGWVQVCNDLTDYLPETTETRKGLTLMDDELTTYGTARIMVTNTTYDTCADLAEQIERIDGVTTATFGEDTTSTSDADDEDQPETPEDIAEYFKGSDGLINVTFAGEEDDEVSLTAMENIKELLSPYDVYIDSSVGDSQADTLAGEMNIIFAIAIVIIVLVLTLTSHSFAEVPVLLITFGAAALLNKGTNFLLGEISFISNSVAVVLQLALAIDYAIILLHRFLGDRQHTDNDRSACISALAAAIPAIASSSLTTVSGLAAMMFMQFRIGFDLGLVLIKAICFSLISVFTLMPGLLILFSKAMAKTQHKNFIPSIDAWGRFVVKARYISVPIFAVLLILGFWMSQQCPYVYGYTLLDTSRQSESQIAEARVNEVFGQQNVAALLVPKGDYEKEKAILDQLETYDEIDTALGLANIEAKDGYTLTDELKPRQFSELIDMDYEVVCLLYSAYAADNEDYGRIVGGIEDYAVPLMDLFLFVYGEEQAGYFTLDDDVKQDLEDMYQQLTDARAQMLGEHYSRMVLKLNLPEEGEETFHFLQTVHKIATQYYDSRDVYLVGNSTSDYDLSTSFAHDNVMISILSVVFVILVLLFTFQSVGLPVLLILVIQGSIFLNFSFPGLTKSPIFFLSYLIVTSIQMGANIDYAIVISTWYRDLKTSMEPKKAIVKALQLSFPTVLTSGSILASAGFLIGKISTDGAIVGIGSCLSRGTLISMFLVMFVLPQILLLGDTIVEKTSFRVPVPEARRRTSGTVFVNGRVRGRISGIVDANIQGVIRGDVSALIGTGAYQNPDELPPEEHDPFAPTIKSTGPVPQPPDAGSPQAPAPAGPSDPQDQAPGETTGTAPSQPPAGKEETAHEDKDQ